MPIFENKLVQAVLWPLSLLYGLGIALRNAAYDRGWLENHAVEALVISVGNISVGGTGKTPVTLFLSQELTRAGVRVGILSRGYGRRTPRHGAGFPRRGAAVHPTGSRRRAVLAGVAHPAGACGGR
ncbi:MAG: tetraacyldisaccharide 4'-kinase [candidate division KSB1 bacterium]|nr:tetraacyldisaccharide 4'-kinase [candidate division KSB1 bacterium]